MDLKVDPYTTVSTTRFREGNLHINGNKGFLLSETQKMEVIFLACLLEPYNHPEDMSMKYSCLCLVRRLKATEILK